MNAHERIVRLLKRIGKEKVKRALERPVTADTPKFIQIVHRTKPRDIWYFRAVPETAWNPTLPQIMARIAFGRAAKKAKGVKFKIGEGKYAYDMPPAAIAVKALKGRKFGRTYKKKKWEELLERWIEYGYI